MRTHGWSGATPADDDEAIARILDAARRRIDLSGKDFGISDVAKDVGVTRQTVYRYFPSTESLLYDLGRRGRAVFGHPGRTRPENP